MACPTHTHTHTVFCTFCRRLYFVGEERGKEKQRKSVIVFFSSLSFLCGTQESTERRLAAGLSRESKSLQSLPRPFILIGILKPLYSYHTTKGTQGKLRLLVNLVLSPQANSHLKEKVEPVLPLSDFILSLETKVQKSPL